MPLKKTTLNVIIAAITWTAIVVFLAGALYGRIIKQTENPDAIQEKTAANHKAEVDAFSLGYSMAVQDMCKFPGSFMRNNDMFRTVAVSRFDRGEFDVALGKTVK